MSFLARILYRNKISPHVHDYVNATISLEQHGYQTLRRHPAAEVNVMPTSPNDVSQYAYACSNLSPPPDAVRADHGDEQVDRPWLPQGRRRLVSFPDPLAFERGSVERTP